MGKTRKGLQAAGIGIAAASVLFFGQAGAAHAPMTLPAPPAIAATAAVVTTQTPGMPADGNGARPLKNVRVRVKVAGLLLSPKVEQTSYARLALGPIRFPDGALNMPGRLAPVAPESGKGEVLKVGHSVSAPTAIERPDPFDFRQEDANRPETSEASNILAGLPLVSPAQAADAASGGEAIGGPLTRLPIQGHILFGNSDTVLTTAAQSQLDRLVEALRAGHAAIEVVAYGGEPDSKSSNARQLALRRGLAVRSYLMSRGIRQARMTVRPIGGARDGGPQARVDVFYASSF